MSYIRKYIGGIISGWIAAAVMKLMSILIRRALQKAARGGASPFQNPFQSRTVNTGRPSSPSPAAPQPAPTPSRQPFRQWAVQDTIYQGMRKSELIAAYGQPDDKARPTFDQEIWTYLKKSSNDNETPSVIVTMDKGVVVDWAEN